MEADLQKKRTVTRPRRANLRQEYPEEQKMGILLTCLLATQAGPNWQDNLEAAKVEAGKTGKALMVLFLTDAKGAKVVKGFEDRVINSTSVPVAKARWQEFVWVRVRDSKVSQTLAPDLPPGNYVIFDPLMNKLTSGGGADSPTWTSLLAKYDKAGFADAEPGWEDRSAASASGKSQGKPVVLVLYEKGAAWDKLSRMLTNRWTAKVHGQFTWCKEETQKDSEQYKSLKPPGVPAVLVLDPEKPDDTAVLERLGKLDSVGDLRERLAKVLKRFEDAKGKK